MKAKRLPARNEAGQSCPSSFVVLLPQTSKENALGVARRAVTGEFCSFYRARAFRNQRAQKHRAYARRQAAQKVTASLRLQQRELLVRMHFYGTFVIGQIIVRIALITDCES